MARTGRAERLALHRLRLFLVGVMFAQ